MRNGITIRAGDGTVHRITTATMLAAMDRARDYLQEAIRWSDERDAHRESGSEEDRDTRRHDRFLKRARIPEDVWFPIDNSFTETDRLNVLTILHCWTEGTLEDFAAAYAEMEEGIDIDPTYLLFGVPIYGLAVEDQDRLRDLGERFACRELAIAAERN